MHNSYLYRQCGARPIKYDFLYSALVGYSDPDLIGNNY